MSPIEYVNPETMHRNPAFTQMISVTGNHRTLYIGGQDAVNVKGEIVGRGDIGAQTTQVLENIQTLLAAGGAGPEHIVKWTLYLVQGQDMRAGFAAAMKFWGNRPNPPTISFAYVAGLANPDFLIEMDAVAVVPE